jgi:protein-disulfide isomerase
VAAAARPARPTRAKVSLADGHVLGRDDAPLTLLEFTDYQCPFCNRFSSSTLPELRSTYIDTGKLRLVSRDLPLAIHANAKQAANAARCAQEQDHYWEMRGTMFANQTRLDHTSLIGLADDLGLDVGEFSTCLTSDRYRDKVQRGATEAAALGITGTPTFVLGRTSGHVLEGEVIVGAQPFATFDVRIRALLGDTN